MTRRINIPIYNGRLYVTTNTDDWRKLQRQFGRGDDGLPDINSIGLTVAGVMRYTDGEEVWTACVHIDVADRQRRDDDTPDWANLMVTIAQESAHAAALLLHDWLGHKITGTDELFPHLVGWFMGTILDECAAGIPVTEAEKTVF